MCDLFNKFVNRIKEAIDEYGVCEIDICYGTSSVECRTCIDVNDYYIYDDGVINLCGKSMITIDPDETEIRYDENNDYYTIASDGQEFEISVYD